jgi:hypothetical protein
MDKCTSIYLANSLLLNIKLYLIFTSMNSINQANLFEI